MSVLWQLDGSQSCTIRWGSHHELCWRRYNVLGVWYRSAHKYTITGLQPGTKYYYQVDGVGTGSFALQPSGDVTYTFAKPISSVSYQVQYTTDLMGTWQNYTGNVSDNGSNLSVTLSNSYGNGGKLYIRLRLEE